METLLTYIGLGLVLTFLVQLLAYKSNGVYINGGQEWEFRGITPRYIFSVVFFTALMPLTFIILIVGLIWLCLATDWAGKPLCSCLKKDKK